MDAAAEMKLKEASIAAVVIRADGSREDLGVISRWRQPWWRRLLERVK